MLVGALTQHLQVMVRRQHAWMHHLHLGLSLHLLLQLHETRVALVVGVEVEAMMTMMTMTAMTVATEDVRATVKEMHPMSLLLVVPHLQAFICTPLLPLPPQPHRRKWLAQNQKLLGLPNGNVPKPWRPLPSLEERATT
jgi:hypothetical protein